jgi:uncharacterized protein
MKPSLALELKRGAIRNAVKKFRTGNPRVFGSVLHGTDVEGSDLDILVDALPGATLFDLGGLQEELEALLGVQVDLRTPGDLSRHFQSHCRSSAGVTGGRLQQYLQDIVRAAAEAIGFVEGFE